MEAASELELIERLELRLAMAADKDQLERTLSTFLAPLLRKAAASNPEAKEKTLALLSHINARLRAEPSIKLNFDSLAVLLTEPGIAQVVRSLAIVYADMAVSRMEAGDRPNCVLSLLQAVSVADANLRQTIRQLVSVFVSCLSSLELPPVSVKATALKAKLAQTLDPTAWVAILNAFIDAMEGSGDAGSSPAAEVQRKRMILNFVNGYVPAASPSSPNESGRPQNRTPQASPTDASPLPPLFWQRTHIFFIGSMHPNHEVSDLAENAMRRSHVDYEDAQWIVAVLRMYTAMPEGVSPSTLAKKLKIVAVLNKSTLAASAFPTCIKVMFDASFAQPANDRLQQAGLGFMQWVARMAKIEQLNMYAPVMLAALLRVINDNQPSLVEFALMALGHLLNRVPNLLDADILQRLFEMTKTVTPTMKLSLQNCMTSALARLSECPENLFELTEGANKHSSELFRWISLRFTAHLAPRSLKTILLHLELTGDESLAVRQEAEAGLSLEVREKPQAENSQTDWPSIGNLVANLGPDALASGGQSKGNAAHSVVLSHAIEYIFRYLQVHELKFSPDSKVKVDYTLRNYEYARTLRDWISGHSDQSAAVSKWLVDCLLHPKSSLSLQAVAARYLRMLRDLGASFSVDVLFLVEKLYSTTSLTEMAAIAGLIPADSPPPKDKPAPGAAHPGFVAAELLRTRNMESCSAVIKDASAAHVTLLSALVTLRDYLLPSEVRVDAELVSALAKRTTTSTQVDAASTAIECLGWIAHSQPDHQDAVLKALVDDLPGSSLSKQFSTVQIVAGEALCIVCSGNGTKCVSFSKYQETKADVRGAVVDRIVAMDGTNKHARRSQITYCECLIKALPHLTEDYVSRIHEIGVRALIVPEFSEAASACLMQLHTSFSGLSPSLMPSLSRALASAPSTAATSSAFVLFDSLVGVARDVKQPAVACVLLRVARTYEGFKARDEIVLSPEMEAACASLPIDDLIPHLFRLRSHSNTTVADSAKLLVQALLKYSDTPLSDHFPRILRQVQLGLTHSAPSTREMSLLALLEVLKVQRDGKGGRVENLNQLLDEDLCKAALRLLDDVHEAIQNAAVRTCTVLCEILSADLVIPYLLDGLSNSSAEVNKFSLTMILKLVQSKPSQMVPHVPKTVHALLDALSSMEPQVLNYLSFHVHKYDMDSDQLDAQRLMLLRDSPTMSCIESLVELPTSAQDMSLLAEALAHVVRKGVGLPTRGGVGRAILLIKRGNLPAVAADDLLKALSGAVFDLNPTVSHVMAAAAAHVIGSGASEGVIVKFLQHIQKQYLTNSSRRPSVANVATACAKTTHARDILTNVMTAHLPLAALGMQELTIANDTAGTETRGDSLPGSEQEQWRFVWQAYVNSESSAVKMYHAEFLQLAYDCLGSSQDWHIQDQAARMISWLCSGHGTRPSSSVVRRLLELCSQHHRDTLIRSLVEVASSVDESRGEIIETLNDVCTWVVGEVLKTDRHYSLLTKLLDSLCPTLSNNLILDPLVTHAERLTAHRSEGKAVKEDVLDGCCEALTSAFVVSSQREGGSLGELPGLVQIIIALSDSSTGQGNSRVIPSAAKIRCVRKLIPPVTRGKGSYQPQRLLQDVACFPQVFYQGESNGHVSGAGAKVSTTKAHEEGLLGLIALLRELTGVKRSVTHTGTGAVASSAGSQVVDADLRKWILDQLPQAPAASHPQHIPYVAWEAFKEFCSDARSL